MKFYITQETKQEIEEKIAGLEKSNSWDEVENAMVFSKCETYKEILSSATILPVEESWEYIDENTHTIPKIYPNGVIIQPKTIKL